MTGLCDVSLCLTFSPFSAFVEHHWQTSVLREASHCHLSAIPSCDRRSRCLCCLVLGADDNIPNYHPITSGKSHTFTSLTTSPPFTYFILIILSDNEKHMRYHLAKSKCFPSSSPGCSSSHAVHVTRPEKSCACSEWRDAIL